LTKQAVNMTPASDETKRWLSEELWPEIHAMMHGDGYFRLWLKAQELAGTPYGPIAQTIINGYATSQLAAIRRMCDGTKGVISLRKLLERVRREYPQQKVAVDHLLKRLETECEEVCRLASSHVAHNANPVSRNWQEWQLTSGKIEAAQRAICEVAIIVERDLLVITQRAHLVPVPQFDFVAELRGVVPADKIAELQAFWHAHNASVNRWTQVGRVA
jgi:hypothetical protein